MTGSDVPDEGVPLAAALAAGDAEALGRAFDVYGRLVFSVAVRILGDRAEAEDVVQDVFLTLWRTAARFDPRRGNLAGYLVTVTRNRAIDRVRRRAGEPAPVGEIPCERARLDDATPLRAAALADGRSRVREVLDGLPEPERAVLVLAYFDGLTQVQIAERTETPLGTVKSRVRSGLRRLRAGLEGGR